MINFGKRYLLIQSCSARKVETDQRIPAIKLSDGYFYRIIKNSEFRSALGPRGDLRILSAEHGVLRPSEEISYYDNPMDRTGAEDLRGEVVEDLAADIRVNSYDEVVVNLGQTYRQAISGLSEKVDVPIRVIKGAGIGEKGHILKCFLEGDTTVLEGDC